MSTNEGTPARRRRGPRVDIEGASAEARRLAAVILEVLAGVRGTTEAARAAGMSPVRYYAAEARAMRGLLAACEPARRGRRPAAGAGDTAGLRQEVERLRKQCARQQTLLRLQQRALGVQAAGTEKGGKKRRRPWKKRTLRLIEGLVGAHEGAAAEAAPAEA